MTDTTPATHTLEVDPERYEAIARQIESADSPVGIDAKRTHVLILDLLTRIEGRLANLEDRVSALESSD